MKASICMMAVLIISVVFVSGCTTETGEVISGTDDLSSIEKTLYEKDTDTSICEKVPSSEGKDCMISLATQNEDLSVCRILRAKYLKPGAFEGDCYSAVAFKTLDISICERMEEICTLYSSNEKNVCLNEVVPIYTDMCYEFVAVGLEDDDLCDLISDPDTKDDCFTLVAIQKGLIEPECSTDIECTISRPFCDNLGFCQETKKCNYDYECRNSEYKPYCLRSQCSDAECIDDSDCPSSMECIKNECGFISCEDNSDCPSDAPICSHQLTGRRCVECVSNSQCPEDKPYCDYLLNECEECKDDSDCPKDRPFCDTSHGCKECKLDIHCDTGQECLVGTCFDL